MNIYVEDMDLFENILYCQYNFFNNDYPIVVIEDANSGCSFFNVFSRNCSKSF